MHVAIVSPYSMARPGGVQTHVHGLAETLAKFGHDVTVFAPELHGQPLVGVQAISIGGAVGIPANGSVAPLGIDPRMLIRFDLALDPADVVHLHEPFLPACLGAMWRTHRDVPVVGTFHAAADGFWPYALTAPVLRRIARRFASTTAVSPPARSLVRRYVDVDPVLVPNGVDVDAYTATEPDPWAAELGTVVLFVGRPEERKGYDVALRAFAGAAASQEETHLVCVGPTEADVVAEGVSERVHCLGPVDAARVRALYRAADIVLIPSRGGESFGLVVVEALAAGARVLASDIPGYRYAGGEAVTYLPPGDLPAWRTGLAAALDDPEALRAATTEGPERAREFDWTWVAEQTLDVYRGAGAD